MKFAFFLLAGLGFAQVNSGIRYVSSAPSGSCSAQAQVRLKTPDGTVYTCQSGTWGAVGGGAASSITVGSTVITGGTANYNLYIDGSGNLGQEQFLGAARFPVLTGDCTTAGGVLAVVCAGLVKGAANLTTTNGLVFSPSNGTASVDPITTFLPCSDTTNCSTGGQLDIANWTSAGGGGPGGARISLGSRTRAALELQASGTSLRILARGNTNPDLLLGSGAVGGFTEIDAVSGIKLSPASGTDITVNNSAHIVTTGTIPVIASGFGSSAAIETGSTDLSGRIGIGTGATAATGAITFNRAFSRAPACSATNETTTLLVKCVATTTTLTLTSSVPWTASDNITWIVLGH